MPLDSRIPLAAIDTEGPLRQRGNAGGSGWTTITDLMKQKVLMSEIEDKDREYKKKEDMTRIMRASNGDIPAAIANLKKAGYMVEANAFEADLAKTTTANANAEMERLKKGLGFIRAGMGAAQSALDNPDDLDAYGRAAETTAALGADGKTFAERMYGTAPITDRNERVRRLQQIIAMGRSAEENFIRQTEGIKAAQTGDWAKGLWSWLSTANSQDERDRIVTMFEKNGMPKSYSEAVPATWDDASKAIAARRHEVLSNPNISEENRKAVLKLVEDAETKKAAEYKALFELEASGKLGEGLPDNERMALKRDRIAQIEKAYNATLDKARAHGWTPPIKPITSAPEAPQPVATGATTGVGGAPPPVVAPPPSNAAPAVVLAPPPGAAPSGATPPPPAPGGTSIADMANATVASMTPPVAPPPSTAPPAAPPARPPAAASPPAAAPPAPPVAAPPRFSGDFTDRRSAAFAPTPTPPVVGRGQTPKTGEAAQMRQLDLTNAADLKYAREWAKDILTDMLKNAKPPKPVTDALVDAFLDMPQTQHNLNIIKPRKK